MTAYIVATIPAQHCASCGARTIDGRVAQPNSYITTDVGSDGAGRGSGR
jgi:hypothetical protein